MRKDRGFLRSFLGLVDKGQRKKSGGVTARAKRGRFFEWLERRELLTNTLYWAPGGVLGGSGTWDTTTANWNTSPSGGSQTQTKWTNGYAAVFGTTAGTVSLASTTIIAASLQFPIGGYTIASNTLTIPSGGMTIDVAQTSGNWTYISSAVTGGGALTKTDAGTLSLSGANNYTGGSVLVGGELGAASSSALGTGTITFDGGTLQYGTNITTDYSNRFVTVAGYGYSVDTNAQNVTWASPLTGSASLTKLGYGTLTLSYPSNSYSGGTTIINGTVAVASANALGSGALGFNQVNQFCDPTLEVTQSLTWSRTMAFLDSSYLWGEIQVDNSATLTMTGTFSGYGELEKIGSGTLTINSTNTSYFQTYIIAGTVCVNGSTPGMVVINGGLLTGTGTTGQIIDQSGSISPGNAGSVGTLTVGGLSMAGSGTSYNVAISNSGADMLDVPSGTVSLGTSAVLNLSGTNIMHLQPVYVLVDNAGGSAVSGTFYNSGGANLAEGTEVATIDGEPYYITYHYNYVPGGTSTFGNGNSVALVSCYSSSTNWSGYAVPGTNVQEVNGTWNVPTAQSQYVATWVGIDGAGVDGSGSSSVEQIGTAWMTPTNGFNNNQPGYYAWVELYGDHSGSNYGPYYYAQPEAVVQANDTIKASVTYEATGGPGGTPTFAFYIKDATSGSQWSGDLYPEYITPARTSAEWIVEDPQGSNFATFSAVSFSNATAVINNSPAEPIDGFSNYPSIPFNELALNGAGNVIAQTISSVLTDSGGASSFTVNCPTYGGDDVSQGVAGTIAARLGGAAYFALNGGETSLNQTAIQPTVNDLALLAYLS
ncbi:MAG: autotransporter-associated beta strand repeat-containing protein [Thermoguttaceae bacterium]